MVYERDSSRLVIQAGPKGGFFYSTALVYKKQLESQGFDVEVRSSESTLDIIDLVNDPSSGVDIGFIAQAVDTEKYANTSTLGAIELEPLFMFYQKKLGDLQDIHQLKGKSVAVGLKKSGTRQLTETVLAAYGIGSSNTRFVEKTLAGAAKDLQAGTVEAAFFLQPPQQELIEKLAKDPQLSMLNIAQATAIVNAVGAERSMRTVTIPAGYFDLKNTLPPKDIVLPAEFVVVVTKKNASQRTVRAVMDAMKALHSKQSSLYDKGYFPRQDEIVMELHPVAEAIYDKNYLKARRNLPDWLSDPLFDMSIVLLPLLALLAPIFAFFGIATPYLFLKSIRHRLWLRDLQHMDEQIRKDMPLSKHQLRKLERIRKQLERHVLPIDKCRNLIKNIEYNVTASQQPNLSKRTA